MENSQVQLKDEIRSIYLAGQIGILDWRHTVVQGLRDNAWAWKDRVQFPTLKEAIYGRYDFSGPFLPHVASASEIDYIPGLYLFNYLFDQLDDDEYMSYCRHAIQRADLVACYFNGYSDKCPSDDWLTASQMLYAISIGKKVLSITRCPFDHLFVEYILAGDNSHYELAPRISLGRQLGLTDAEIDNSAGFGFVYFIEATASRHIKIGWANDPNRRLQEFQTGAPTEYKLIGTIPGSKKLEHKLHKEFDEYRAQREWFFGVKPLRHFIKSNVLNLNSA